MKKLFVVAMAVILGMSGTSAWANNDNEHDGCTRLAYSAYVATKLRQENIPLAKAKKVMEETLNKDMAAMILNLAYSQPIAKTEKEKEEVATNIAVQVHEACKNGL